MMFEMEIIAPVAYRRYLLVLVLVLAWSASACGGGKPDISIQDPWVRPAVAGGAASTSNGMSMDATTTSGDHMLPSLSTSGESAAYMTIVNHGGSDELMGASSDAAGMVKLHKTVIQDNVARMEPVESITVPANGQVQIEPAGYHIMLMDLKHDLKPGDTVKLTLKFKKAGNIQVSAPVRQP